MSGPSDRMALTPTRKLTTQGPFSTLGSAGLNILREVWGLGHDTWVDHT